MKRPDWRTVPLWLRVTVWGVVIAAAAGAVFGVHAAALPAQPAGWRGATVAGLIGLVLGLAAGWACDTRLSRWWRVAAGGLLGALAGTACGWNAVLVAAPAGLVGAAVGVVVGAGFLAVPLPRLLLLALAAFAVTGLGDPLGMRSTTPQPSPELEAVQNYDVTPRPVGGIPAGTVVDSPTPDGWSYRVLVLDYRVGSGDVSRLPAGVADGLERLSHVYLASVEAEPRPNGPPAYRLSRLGVGISTPVRGRDTVVTPDQLKEVGANLDLATQAALGKHQERLPTIWIVARSNTMAVIDSPIYVNRDDRHRQAVMRQAWLIDPSSGRLEPLFWLLVRDGDGFRPLGDPLTWLQCGGRYRLLSHVDAREFTFGLPLKEPCMAIQGPPQGRQDLAVTPELRGLLNRGVFTEDEARSLERALRQALHAAAPDFPAGGQ
jgi:hypothetical protein